MRDANGPDHLMIFVEYRRLVGLELLQAMFALYLFVKGAGLFLTQHDLFGLKTDIFALLIFLLLQIPYIVVSSALNVVFRLAHGTAKGVVHLQMRAAYVFEPDKVRNAVYSHVKAVRDEPFILFQLDALQQTAKAKGGQPRHKRPLPYVVKIRSPLRQTFAEIGAEHKFSAFFTDSAQFSTGAFHRQIEHRDVAFREALHRYMAEGPDLMFKPLKRRDSLQLALKSGVASVYMNL